MIYCWQSIPTMQNRITFPTSSKFTIVLRSRVDEYFREHHIAPTGNRELYIKTFFGYSLFLASYIFLVFFAESLWMALFSAFFFAQSSIFIGFNVMHDGAHGSYSSKKWVNTLMGTTMDILGSNQFLWKQKHNILHHTFTNIHHKDDDIETLSTLRFSPNQTWRKWHQYQCIYAPIIYAILSLIWIVSDFFQMFQASINGNPLPKRGSKIWFNFLFMKFIYFFFMLILPAFFHPFSIVFLLFLGTHLIFGFTIALIFSLAHITNRLEFPEPKSDGIMEHEWMGHQLRTTTDFAPTSKFATWYMGGLNYQVVHHLFQNVSHVHYPQLRIIVEKTCQEYDMPYHCSPTFIQAVIDHYDHLRHMGMKPQII